MGEFAVPYSSLPPLTCNCLDTTILPIPSSRSHAPQCACNTDNRSLPAPSQTLPDNQHDSGKPAPRSMARPDVDTNNDFRFEQTIRMVGPESSATRMQPHSRQPSHENAPPTPGGLTSPRAPGPITRSNTGGIVVERPIDPTKTATYGHHRQTSIVHGMQHSRNGSLTSPTSGPLSPQMIAAAGVGLDRPDMQSVAARLDGDLGTSPRNQPNFMGVPPVPPSPIVMERSASAIDLSSGGMASRKNDTTHTKARRENGAQHSQSSRYRDEQKTVGEYALHVLFTSFIAQAEEKLNDCITVPFEPEPHIEKICGPGVDSSFDQLIVALGHIASPKPKALIDSMMLWRKSKSDAANEARAQLQQSRSNPGGPLLRRNTEPTSPNPDGSLPNGASLTVKQEFVAQAERRSTVSIYILCRVLLEVICQSNLASITPEMEDKLESIIFGQLKIADGEQLLNSHLKLANWNLFSQLLGHMSEINFKGITRRFIDDLNSCLQERGLKSPTGLAGRESEGKIELVLGGMRHLRIKISPESAWEQSCDFLIALGRLFSKSHGQRVKWAFCQILDTLLIPVAAKASNSHLMHPKWTEVTAAISPRLAQLHFKPRHWPAAFPLTATLLCVSSPDNYGTQWLQLIQPLLPKLKDRTTRPLCLQVVSRLVWTYLYRTNDSPQGSARKLDEVMRLIIPQTAKRIFIASDTSVIDPLLQLIRVIGFKLPEYCFRNIIFPLMNAELFINNRELRVEQLDPDRIVIGIRAFLQILSDLEKGEQGQPPLPQYDAQSLSIRTPSSLSSSSQRQSALNGAGNGRKEDTISRPVLTHVLTDSVRDYYAKFCEILGKITIICDNTFGGQATLDEKFNSTVPKPAPAESFTFSRRDDHQNTVDQKQAFYELLHVAVEALPRCMSVDIPFNSIINLLCTGTAHVQLSIAESSAHSLKAIAKQSHAQQVTMGFSRFIFNFDDRYSTMSDGGMLGPGHIESTLRLYVELLQIWIEEIKKKTRDAASNLGDGNATDQRALKLDLSTVWAEVDQAEAHGLFFLCSQSRRVRYYAVTVLRLITEFDKALGKDSAGEEKTLRLIDIVENDSSQVMDYNDESLSVGERSRLQRGLQNHNKGAIVDLCTSDITYDSALWFKIFPNLMRIFYDQCPFAVTICRDLVCNRVIQMYKSIVYLSEPARGLYYNADPSNPRAQGRAPPAQPDSLIEQWKLYLIFACTTMADPGSLPAPTTPKDPSPPQHNRKGSRAASKDKIVTARTLFKYLIPMLSASSASVRDAVVVAMGSINIQIYRSLLEELQGQVSRCNDEARARIHQRTNSSPRRNRKMDLLRTEITHVYKLTSHFLRDQRVYQNEFFLNNLTSYAKDLKLFLMDGEVQMDWEFQKLRQHYCGLMEALFDGINRTDDPLRWMTFESRKSAFSLMEDWCGFSPNQTQIRAREDTMRQSLIDQQHMGERGTATAAMEIEKRNLRTAALSAMAALCAGPISVTTESGVLLQFDIRRMLAWVEAIFNSGSDKMNVIGRKALKNLVIHNREYPYLLEHCIARCYLADAPKVLESYFLVTVEVLQDQADYPCSFWKILALCLFTLGNPSSEIRTRSSAVLRSLEARHQRNSKIQDFDISISDKTQAVYKLAQFEISKRLANSCTELAFHIFCEFTLYFKDLQAAAQRNVVAVVLPWIQAIELKLDSNGGPTAQSYVLLANLLEITIKSSGALHNEVQALWQALATGPHPGNVRLVLDFIMQLCLERREQNFVEYAKQIVVFLSTTNSTPGIKVVEFLLMQITPKAMVPHEKRDATPHADVDTLPYCADLAEALPVGAKQAGFSLGQLSLILLVDLMVSPLHLIPENIPPLLHVVMVLWDHYTPLVQEQAREMLVHLIHELIISRLDDNAQDNGKDAIEELIDLVRRHDRSVVWGYEDSNGKVEDVDNKVPPSMEYLTTEVVQTFEAYYPGVKEQWGRLSLTWATSCPVRHLACRSFQIFRCVLTSLDQLMLGDMLARLSNTIADEDAEIQSFSMEILTTLKTLIAKLDTEKLLTFPQLFWTTCACLESINEREFLEAVEMLNEWLEKVELRPPNIRRLIADGQPSRWEGTFEGLQSLVHKGLRSSLCWQPTLDTMDKMVKLPSDPLIGDDNRLFYCLLANFPRFLNELEQNGSPSEEALKTARLLLSEADKQGLEGIGLMLDDFILGKLNNSHEFLGQYFAAFREYYLPQRDFKMITFLIGLLTNSLSWVKIQTMRILCVAIPEVDMRNPELAGHGSDLISPLLRLLQTEFCMNALEVLDNIMTVSGSHMDKHHLRMSMTRATSKVVRKEYERTQSLFGIPEASGWAIPIPAQKTEATRANIHAAFYMCQSAEGPSPEATPTAEVEFHEDGFPYEYFDSHDRTETMLSDDGRGEAPVGDLLTNLDSLDDFFDEPSSPHTDDDGRSSMTVTEYTPESFESGTQLYDEQILPILHQASSNNTTFQNGFAERPHALLASPRESSLQAMNPGAFTAAMHGRPSMHNRSITSPSAPPSFHLQMGSGDMTSDDEYLSGGMSDADDEFAHSGTFFFDDDTARPQQRAPPQPSLRRWTSRSKDERGRDKLPQQGTPKLPNSANMYPSPKMPGGPNDAM